MLASTLGPAYEPENGEAAAGANELPPKYTIFANAVYRLLTSVGEGPETERLARDAGAALNELLEADEIPYGTAIRIAQEFGDAMVEHAHATQYLCWARATPGEVVNLTVTYTVADGRDELEEGHRSEDESVLAVSDDAAPGFGGRLRRWGWRFRRFRVRWYRQFGLAPLNYAFKGPSRMHAGSYYFSLEAPPQTSVTHLSCDEPSSMVLEDGTLNCAFPSVHVHDETSGPNSSPKGWTIRAYLRPDLREHKLIAGTAMLNLAFVFLIALGRLTDKLDASSQTWVLLTPTLLTAFLAQQQRHYYALATRRQRAVLWFYLFFSVLFLVAVSFSLARTETGSGRWGLGVTMSALLLAGSSAIVLACYAQLGYWAKQRIERMISKSKSQARAWDIYQNAALRLADRIFVSAIVLTVAATMAAGAIYWSRGSATARLQLSQVRFTTDPSPAGARLAAAHFFLNQYAVVTFSVVRKGGGVQVDGRCVARTRRFHYALPACDLLVQRVSKAIGGSERKQTLTASAPLLAGAGYRLSLQAQPGRTPVRQVIEAIIPRAP